jgi:hypothetical protein
MFYPYLGIHFSCVRTYIGLTRNPLVFFYQKKWGMPIWTLLLTLFGLFIPGSYWFVLWILLGGCRNPTLAKCGGEAQHLEKLEVGSLPGLPNVQSSTARGKTPRIGVFLMSLERSWNVDIENALALAIRTSAAQVMGKRRAGSQTGSLTPDH